MVLQVYRALAVAALSFSCVASAYRNYSSIDTMRAQLSLMDDRPKDCPPWYDLMSSRQPSPSHPPLTASRACDYTPMLTFVLALTATSRSIPADSSRLATNTMGSAIVLRASVVTIAWNLVCASVFFFPFAPPPPEILIR